MGNADENSRRRNSLPSIAPANRLPAGEQMMFESGRLKLQLRNIASMPILCHLI